MAIAVVQSAASNSLSSATAAATFTTALTSASTGNLLIAFVTAGMGNTQTLPSGWAVLLSDETTSNSGTYAYYKFSAGNETGISVALSSASDNGVFIVQISGMAAGATPIATGSTGSSTATVAFAAQSPTVAGSAILELFTYYSKTATVSGPPSGYTALASASGTAYHSMCGYVRLNAPVGSDGTASATLSASDQYGALSILVAPPAVPAATFVQGVTAVPSGAYSASATFAATPTAGNLLIAFCSAYYNAAQWWTTPAGWHILTPLVSNSTGAPVCIAFWKISAGNETTVTVAHSQGGPTNVCMTISEWSNAAKPSGNAALVTAPSATVAFPAQTPISAGSVIVEFVSAAASEAVSTPAGYTAIPTISPTAAGQTFGFYFANPPTGSDGTASSTLSAASLYSASSILIPPAASPTVAPSRRRVTSETLLAA